MKRKKSIVDYRVQLGLNQETMAEYLGIGRGLLSMAEIGDRPLPFAANIKLLDMIQALMQAKAMALPEALLQLEKENLHLALQKELDEVRYQLLKQGRELEKLEKDYAHAVVQMQFFEYIHQHPAVLKADERMQAILQSQAKQSLRNWQKTLQALCFLKKTVIESLQQQKQRIEERLGSM